MAEVSAHDVARELRRRLRGAGDVKIHKLLYYCQGWHAAWTGQPLFTERIEAWVNGPVVAELWRDEKHDRPRPSPQKISEKGLETIDFVVGRYGQFTGKTLIRATHLEDPWRDASEIEDSWATRDPEITVDALRAWFSSNDEYVELTKAADDHRSGRDVFDLGPRPLSDFASHAVAASVAGQRVRDSRPA